MVLQKPAPTLEVLLQRYFFLCKVIFCQEKTNSATFPLLLLLPSKFHLLLLFSATFEKSSGVFRYLATVDKADGRVAARMFVFVISRNVREIFSFVRVEFIQTVENSMIQI